MAALFTVYETFLHVVFKLTEFVDTKYQTFFLAQQHASVSVLSISAVVVKSLHVGVLSMPSGNALPFFRILISQRKTEIVSHVSICLKKKGRSFLFYVQVFFHSKLRFKSRAIRTYENILGNLQIYLV